MFFLRFIFELLFFSLEKLSEDLHSFTIRVHLASYLCHVKVDV